MDKRNPMDFPSLKKTLKNQGSCKQQLAKKLSTGGTASSLNCHEEMPILGDHNDRHAKTQKPSTTAVGSTDSAEVIVKVDAGNSSSERSSAASGIRPRRESSSVRGHEEMEDPPSVLIGQFLNKQRMTGGEISLDMDIEMDELRRELSYQRNLPPAPESPPNGNINLTREIRVSFDPSVPGIESASESVRRRCRDFQEGKLDDISLNGDHRHSEDEVLRCTSNSTFRSQPSGITRLKTKSRILDPPPEELEKKSGKVPLLSKSGISRSGFLNTAMTGDNDDDHDDDPLEDEDLPEEYMKRSSLDILTILQWLSLIAIIAALACSLSIGHLKEERFLQLKLWKWEVLLLVLICGRLVSGWWIRIIVFFIERNFLLRKRVLYFVYGLKSGVQNCWWLGLVLLAWHFLFDEKVQRETKGNFLKYVNKILICFLVANFVWLLKTLMVKVLASSFHVSTYFDRIQESIFNQYVIETLSGPPWIEIQRNEDEANRTFAEIRRLQDAGANVPAELKAAVSGCNHKTFRAKSFKLSRQLSMRKVDKVNDNGITIDHLHKLNPRNISAWNMKRLMNIVKYGSLSTLDEQIHEAGIGDESATEIRSEYEARAAARKIFHNVARHGAKYIYFQDLMRFMREDEAIKTMNFFEGASENKRISKSSLRNWVVNAFRDRRALALTLNDTKTAVNKLHQVVNVIVSVIIVVIWLLILGIATSKFMLFMGSQILVVSFIFGNTCKTLFESIIFLFLIHPFDVGDRCEVDGVQMIVEEMNILTTIFLRGDNLKITFPNNILATRPIGNFYRSPDMSETVEFYINISTPPETIDLMKQKIISYIEGTKEHWYPSPTIIMKELDQLNKMKVAVWTRHRINHQDIKERYGRRSLLIEAFVKIFEDLDIQYRLFPLDVNIQTMPPWNSCCPPP